MAYYPIFLQLEGRPCAVIGGGEVAQRKVEGLLAAGARVRVVSPTLTPSLEGLREQGRIEHMARGYCEGDLRGLDICVIATDDEGVNEAAAAEGRRRGVWVNVADEPARCDFIVPSVIRRGEVVVAVSTGGASPALARRLREELEAYLGEEMPAVAELLGKVRRELRERGISPEAEAWQRAIDKELRMLVAQHRLQEAEARLLASLGVPAQGSARAAPEV